jgi:hypothetical protein
MKVLVTGGAGRVGVSVVERLVRAGYEVTVIGRRAGLTLPGARYAQCDVTDSAALLYAMRGMNAVVHLAAIPGPISRSEEIFRVNCQGTFTLYETAARAGIRRVVTASSINSFGYNFGTHTFPVRALPVDETQPGIATDAYSFSKQVTEQVADYAWRRDGISGVCLRLPFVAPAEFSGKEHVVKHARLCRASFEALMTPGLDRAREKTKSWVDGFNAWRANRPFEQDGPFPSPKGMDPLMFGRTDFWTRIDCRDSAQAVEKSLTAELTGSHVLFVNDSHNYTGVPSLALARLFFPESRLGKRELRGTSTLVSIRAARALIGFEPEHSVARWLDES